MTITTTRGARALRVAVLPLVVGAAVGLTACGDSGGSSTTAAATGAAQQGGYGQDGARRGGLGAQTPEEREKLQACLKQQGVTLPTGRGGPGGPGGAPPTGTTGAPPTGTDGAPPSGAGGPGGGLPGGGRAGGRGGTGMTAAEREKFQAALKSCGVTTPTGGGQRAGRGRPDVGSAAYRKSIEAYVACVKKNGFDLPKPNFTGNGPIFDPKEVDQTDAAFKKASAACQSTLRSGTGGGSGSGGSGSSSGASGAQS